MLKLLQLQGNRNDIEAEVSAANLDDGRAPDVRPDYTLGNCDSFAADRIHLRFHRRIGAMRHSHCGNSQV
jgi:hypothetical protein